MRLIARLLIMAVLLAAASMSAFGFLATFEPPGSMAWRIMYASTGIAFVTVACVMLILWRRGHRRAK